MTTLPTSEPAVALAEATMERLRECGQEATPEGLLALELARQIDAGGHSGASLASLSSAFSRALETASERATPEADVIDRIFSAR